MALAMPACGCFPSAPLENKIPHNIEAVDAAQAENMVRVCKDEELLLKSMEVDCAHLKQLRDTGAQLEERKRQMQAQLAEQTNRLEAIRLQPPTSYSTNYQRARHPPTVPLPTSAQPPTNYYPLPTSTQLSYNIAPKTRLASSGIGYLSTGGDVKLGQVLPNYQLGGSSFMAPGSDFKYDKEVRIHTVQVNGVAMGNGGDTIATASADGSAKIFSLRASQVVKTFNMSTDGGLTAVAFSKTADDLIGCPASDQSVYLWNYQAGLLKHRFVGHTEVVNDIDFHPTQPIMATVSSDCKCIVWDVMEGISLRSLDKHSRPVFGCTFLGHQNQYLIATGSFDQYVRIFDMRDQGEVHSPKEHTANVMGMDYNSQKQLMATGSDDGTICIWDARTWTSIWDTQKWTVSQRIDASDGSRKREVKRVAFSPNGALVAAGTSTGHVLVYETDSGRQVASLDGHMLCASDVSWGVEPQTGAKLLVSASHDGTCRVWRAMI